MLTSDRHFISSIHDVHCSLRSDGKSSSQVKLRFQSSCVKIFALIVNRSTIPDGSNILSATLNMVRLVSLSSFLTSSMRSLMLRERISFSELHTRPNTFTISGAPLSFFFDFLLEEYRVCCPLA